MHWYLVHTKPRQEMRALQNLERQGYQCYLPTIPSEKLRHGALVIANEPLFPRYLFIRLGQDHTAKSWSPIRSTKGVSRLVTFGAKLAQIDNVLVEHLQMQETLLQNKPKPLFHHGETVHLIDTPFTGIEGIYQMSDGEHRAMVLIEILSKTITLNVALDNLRKAG